MFYKTKNSNLGIHFCETKLPFFPNLIILSLSTALWWWWIFSTDGNSKRKEIKRKESSAEKKWLHSYADLWPHEVYNLILEANYTMETNQKNNNTDKTNSKRIWEDELSED